MHRLLLVAAAAAWFVPLALFRLIDADEGFYLMAARSVGDGQGLYSDFFFPQMPLLPYLHAAWFAVVGRGWWSARLLSAAIAVACALLVYDEAFRLTGRRLWAVAACFLFAACGYTIGWFTVAKTYGLAALLLLGGVRLLRDRPGARWLGLAGLLTGLAISTRLVVVVALPALALFVWLRDRSWRAVGALALGATAGLLPALLCFARAPEAFWFDVVRFHGLREPGQTGLIGDLPQKWATFLSAVGISFADGGGAIQLLGLGVPALAGLATRRGGTASPSAFLWPALLVTGFLPTPAYPQYACLAIPFVAIEAAAWLARVAAPPLRSAWVAGAIVYAALAAGEAERHLVTGSDVPGVEERERAHRWRIGNVLEIARQIDRQGFPAGASWWPGYFVSTRTALPPTLVNDFGTLVGARLTPAERARYRIVAHEEVNEMIRRRALPLFVEGNWTVRASADLLPRNGYTSAGTLHDATIWILRTR